MGTPLRVLIVEDSEDDALLLLRQLRRGGYEPVHERVDTPAGMEAALDGRDWELVISDHSMPSFSSSAALELLQRKGLDLPFIIVSGQIGEGSAVAAMKAGAHDYIMKDNLARLNTAIERELREAEVRRERKQAVEALQRSESSLAAAQRIAHIGNFEYSINRDEARWSDELYRIFGFAPRQFVPTYRTFLNSVHPDDRELLRKAVREALYSKKQVSLEYRIVRPSGEVRVVHTQYELSYDEDRPVKITGTVQDITERKEAEKALKEAEEKYRGIFENAMEGIFQTTVEGRFLTANPALARMFGYESPEELLANVSDVGDQLYVEPEQQTEFDRLMREHGAVSGFEVQIYRKDGSTVWVSANARAVRDATGELVGYEGTVEDITERKRAETALREIREAERRRIARDLHDEAMQDLAYVLQSMQLARMTSGDGGSNGGLKQEIVALRRAIAGLRNAVYDLRLGSSQDRSFLQSLESLVELNRQMAPERALELSVEDGFPTELADDARVELLRIVQEALVNVRRHSGASRACVTLWRKEDEIWVEVEDDGRGFDPGRDAGTGLTGMRERAYALGGKLEVQSEPEKGTRVRFRVALPTPARSDRPEN
jgi:two-component system, NarL family, sensor histidine kinase UhpB